MVRGNVKSAGHTGNKSVRPSNRSCSSFKFHKDRQSGDDCLGDLQTGDVGTADSFATSTDLHSNDHQNCDGRLLDFPCGDVQSGGQPRNNQSADAHSLNVPVRSTAKLVSNLQSVAKLGDSTGTTSAIASSSGRNNADTCYLCQMDVTNLEIHWRLNHRRVRLKPGAPKFCLGFSVGESMSSRKSERRKRRLTLDAVPSRLHITERSPAAPVVICCEPDPLEMYPDELPVDNSQGNLCAEDGGQPAVFSLNTLPATAQRSAAKSAAFLQRLGKPQVDNS